MDTLAYAKRLRAAGFSEDQVDALTEGLRQAAADECATKGDIADVKCEILALEARLMRFLVVQAVAIIGFVVALLKLLP